ncbi:formin-like protein 5 [Iris pallida]|uniref:Formin-like protein 5 n=1 Tax=Iris pallida TaxID=29817 RepID=A0AAX6FYW7_IRIPA|nr:formin-like protein 5 [Iris pallida]
MPACGEALGGGPAASTRWWKTGSGELADWAGGQRGFHRVVAVAFEGGEAVALFSDGIGGGEGDFGGRCAGGAGVGRRKEDEQWRWRRLTRG